MGQFGVHQPRVAMAVAPAAAYLHPEKQHLLRSAEEEYLALKSTEKCSGE
jgi:hypothetical protein